MSGLVADRKRMVATLVDLLVDANRRDIAALERQGWPGIPEVPVGDMEIHCGHLIDSLIKADLFRDEAAVKAEALEEAAEFRYGITKTRGDCVDKFLRSRAEAIRTGASS